MAESLFAPGELERLTAQGLQSLRDQGLVPSDQPPTRGIPAQIGAGVLRAPFTAAAMIPRALSAVPLLRPVTEPVAEFIEDIPPAASGGFVEAGIESAGSVLLQLLAFQGAALPAIARTAPRLAAILGTNTGTAASIASVFAGSEFAQSRQELEDINATLPPDQRIPTDEITRTALVSGLAEGGLEFVSEFALLRFFPWLRQGAASQLANALRQSAQQPGSALGRTAGRIRPLATAFAKTAAVEVPSEAATAAIQAGARQGVLAPRGFDTPTPGEAALAAIPPTLVASGIFAGAGRLSQRATERRALAILDELQQEQPGGAPAADIQEEVRQETRAPAGGVQPGAAGRAFQPAPFSPTPAIVRRAGDITEALRMEPPPSLRPAIQAALRAEFTPAQTQDAFMASVPLEEFARLQFGGDRPPPFQELVTEHFLPAIERAVRAGVTPEQFTDPDRREQFTLNMQAMLRGLANPRERAAARAAAEAGRPPVEAPPATTKGAPRTQIQRIVQAQMTLHRRRLATTLSNVANIRRPVISPSTLLGDPDIAAEIGAMRAAGDSDTEIARALQDILIGAYETAGERLTPEAVTEAVALYVDAPQDIPALQAQLQRLGLIQGRPAVPRGTLEAQAQRAAVTPTPATPLGGEQADLPLTEPVPAIPGVRRRRTLGNTPDEHLELAQLMRKPRPGFPRGGIRTAGEELESELRQSIPRSMINNKSGMTLQQAAELAQQSGHIETADKTALISQLFESTQRDTPVFSVNNPRFFELSGGQGDLLRSPEGPDLPLDPVTAPPGGERFDASVDTRRMATEALRDLIDAADGVFIVQQPEGPGLFGGPRARPSGVPGLPTSVPVRRRGGIRRLFQGVPATPWLEAFKRHGAAQVVGQTIRSHRDLAVIGQGLRDPRFETLWVIPVGADGTALGMFGVSSRNPASSRIFPTEINGFEIFEVSSALPVGTYATRAEAAQARDELGRLTGDRYRIQPKPRQQTRESAQALTTWLQANNAQGYYMLHNHPSGNPMPSGFTVENRQPVVDASGFMQPASALHGDLSATANYRELVPGLLGHVVVEGDQYGLITPDLRGQLLDLPAGTVPAVDPLQQPAIDVLGVEQFNLRTIESAEDLEAVARAAEMDPNLGLMVYVQTLPRGPGWRVQGIEQVPAAMLRNPDALELTIQNRGALFGAPEVAVVGFNAADQDTNLAMRTLFERGVVRDYLILDMPRRQRVLMAKELQPQGITRGQLREGRTVPAQGFTVQEPAAQVEPLQPEALPRRGTKEFNDLAAVGAGLLGSGATGIRAFTAAFPALQTAPQDYQRQVFGKAQQAFKAQMALARRNNKVPMPSMSRLLTLASTGSVGEQWYDEARAELERLFPGDADMVAKFIASLSPGTKVEANVENALVAYAAWKQDQAFTKNMFTGRTFPNMLDNLDRARRGGEVSGPKVNPFYRAIMGDRDAVPIDLWMIRVFNLQQFGPPRTRVDERGREITEAVQQKPSRSQTLMLQTWITQLARQEGIDPRGMQAMLWVGAKLLAPPVRGESREQVTQLLDETIRQKARNATTELVAANPSLSPLFAGLDEAGSTNVGVIMLLARAMSGALIGGASGDDPEDRLRNALIGAGLGALASPALLRRLLRDADAVMRVPPSVAADSQAQPSIPEVVAPGSQAAEAPLQGEETLPPVPPGHVRLYRGEPIPGGEGRLHDWIRESPEFQQMLTASGRWFTDSKAEAMWYVNEAAPRARMVYLDVPERVAQQAHLSQQPREVTRFSANSNVEYFLPTEFRGQGTEIRGVVTQRGDADVLIQETPPPEGGLFDDAAETAQATAALPPDTPETQEFRRRPTLGGITVQVVNKEFVDYAVAANVIEADPSGRVAEALSGQAFRKLVIPRAVSNQAGQQWLLNMMAQPGQLRAIVGRMQRGEQTLAAHELDGMKLWMHTLSHDALAKLGEGAITQEQFEQRLSNMARFSMNMAITATSEAGRILRATQDTPDGVLNFADFVRRMNTQMRNSTQRRDLTQAEKDALIPRWTAAMQSGDPSRAMLDLLQQTTDPTTLDLYWELYYGSILSGIPTQVVNTAGTFLHLVFHDTIIEGTMAGLDGLVAGIKGQQRSRYLSDIAQAQGSVWRNALPALQSAWYWWAAPLPRGLRAVIPGAQGQAIPVPTRIARGVGGDRFRLDIGAPAWERANKGPAVVQEFMHAAAPFVGAAGRALQAADMAMKTLAFDAEVIRGARRMAREQNPQATEAELRQQVREVQENLVNFPAIEETANQVRLDRTFNDQPGKLFRTIENLRQLPQPFGFMFRLLVPFAATPDRLLARGLELVPGIGLHIGLREKGLTYRGFLPDLTQRDPLALEVAAKQVVGVLLTALAYGLWRDDRLTGPVAKEPARREAQFRQGRIPHSIVLNGTAYEYRRFEPLNLPMGAAAAAFEAMTDLQIQRERQGIPVDSGFVGDMLAISALAAGNFTRFLLDSSYFSGLANFFAGVQRGGGGIVKGATRQLVAATLPFSSLQRSVARMLESTGMFAGTEFGEFGIREATTVGQQFGRAIPGVSTQVRQRTDVFGEPITQEISPPEALISPVRRATITTDPVEVKLRQLNVFPSQPQRGNFERQLGRVATDTEFLDFRARRGQLAKADLDRLISLDFFDRLSPERQRKRIRSILSRATRRATSEARRAERTAVGF